MLITMVFVYLILWQNGYVSGSRPIVHILGWGLSPALILGVVSMGKRLNTNFLVLSETDVKLGGRVYLLSPVHI